MNGLEKEIKNACKCGDTAKLKVLKLQGVNIRLREDESIKIAGLHNHLDTVKYLVSEGADITVGDNIIARLASANNRKKMLDYVISLGVWGK